MAELYDVKRAIDGVKLSREIMAQKAFHPYLRGEHIPGPAVRGETELEEFVRRAGRSAYHPVGTCRMGAGEAAVLDPELRVRGVEGLRVCDSSIMPNLISSNTNAAVIMIAEKGSDLIRNRTPLAQMTR